MRNSKSYSFFVVLSALISFFVGIRFSDVGTDSEQYRNHFYNSSVSEGFYDRFEVGFSLLMQLFSILALSVEAFFFFISFLITTIYLYFFKNLYSKSFYDKHFQFSRVLAFFSLLLFSSWYITSITNGLRQGVALVFIYIALFELFYNHNKVKFSVFYLLSISFHYSSIIISPFLLLYFFRFKYVFILWVLSGAGYFFGVNELVVKVISDRFSLPVYEFVKFYSLQKGAEKLGGGLYDGFIVEFFIYTIFWPVLLLSIIKTKSRFKSGSVGIKEIYTLLKMYFLLSMPYFILGFGPFSNRYAMFAWFLVPVLQFYIINIISFRGLFSFFSIVIFLVSLFFFLFFRLDWIRLLW